MRFVRGVRRRDFLLFLLAGRTEFQQILRALSFVFGLKLREVGNVLCFGFGKLTAEDDGQRLSAFDVIAKHDGNFFHDPAHKRCYVNFSVFIDFHDSRNAELCGGDAVCNTHSANLRLL